jgi:hypothetical protein
MPIDFNDITAFLSSGFGIALQVALFGSAVVPILRYLNERFDKSVDDHIKKKLDPYITDLCKQLGTISTKLHDVDVETRIAIKYINRAIMHLQYGHDEAEIKDYRLLDKDEDERMI